MSELVEANLKFHGSRSFAYAPLKHPHSQTVCESGNMFHFVAQSQKMGIAKADGFWSDGAEGPVFAVAGYLHGSAIRR